ncbi:MAG: M48 family metalloprotease [Candidatus Omnitrophica bacterium]|nr:M48 family metalloprotease [Candidatus Omnitrophota bacterium]
MLIKYIFSILILGCIVSGCAQSYYNVATQQEETYFYSDDKEVKIGKALSVSVEKKFKPDNDPLIQQRVNQIGQKLVEVNDRKEINYYFKVLESKKDEINAFALPGGYVYIFRALWDEISDNDAQIAAVLSHEIAHIAARHSVKRMQSAVGANVMSILILGSNNMDQYSKRKAIVGINELILSYSRKDEIEADVLATKYLERAGYNTSGVTTVLDVLEKTQRDKPIRASHWRTHPYIAERKKAVNQEINNGTIKFNDYINTVKIEE